MTKLLEQIQARVNARYAWSALILGTAGLTLSGCPGGAELENADQHLGAGPACDATPIFETKCGGTACHGVLDSPASAGGVNLVQPFVEARLVDVPAAYPAPATGCPSPPELLINSADLDASLLWTKLNNTQQCGDGMPVPHSLVALNDTDMACVYSWMQSVITGDVTPGTGGTTGTGGADGAGTGGDGSGTGGTVGTGGDGAGTGGASGDATPIRVEAECALDAGECGNVTASATGPEVDRPMLEAGNMQVGYIITGVTLTYAGIETAGHDSITLQYAKLGAGGSLEIRLESAAGTLLGTATPAETGAWDTYMPMTVPLSQALTGTQTIVLVAVDSDAGVLNLDWFELTAGSAL